MRLRWFLVVVLVALAYGSRASAADVDFGFQVDWNKFEDVDDGDLGVGARLDVGGTVRLITSFDYYFVDAFEDDIPGDDEDFDLKFWEVNANLAFNFTGGGVRPYVGGGVGIARQSFDALDDILDDDQTELGFNVLGGLKFGDAVVEPFVEVRGTFYTGDETFPNRFILTGGIVF